MRTGRNKNAILERLICLTNFLFRIQCRKLNELALLYKLDYETYLRHPTILFFGKMDKQLKMSFLSLLTNVKKKKRKSRKKKYSNYRII